MLALRFLASARRFLASALLCLYGGHASAAEESWELFATGRTSKIYFDRGSVSKAEDYVQYRIRVEYADDLALDNPREPVRR